MNASFVAAMEDIPGAYARAYKQEYPVVCMDESSMQFLLINKRQVIQILSKPNPLCERGSYLPHC